MPTDAATILGAAGGTATVMLVFAFAVMKRVRPFLHIMDDLVGEESRPGRAAQPGLMERMQANEAMTLSAAEQAAAAKQSAWRVEDLVRRHMENGLAIMEVGLHNDAQLHTALQGAGIPVLDIRAYPDVDLGDPAPTNRREGDPL